LLQELCSFIGLTSNKHDEHGRLAAIGYVFAVFKYRMLFLSKGKRSVFGVDGSFLSVEMLETVVDGSFSFVEMMGTGVGMLFTFAKRLLNKGGALKSLCKTYLILTINKGFRYF
jgi:hypothetical protein